MNWIGGALARAKAHQERNRDRFPTRVRRDRESPPIDDEEEENDNDILEGNEGQHQPQRSRRTSRNKRREEPEWKRELDYEALGYELVVPRPTQRRVVPLLEFVEKEFPLGHVISLQLSHQMDITSTPIPSTEDRPSFENCPTDVTSQTSNSTYSITSQTSGSSSRVENVEVSRFQHHQLPNLFDGYQTSQSTTTNEPSTL